MQSKRNTLRTLIALTTVLAIFTTTAQTTVYITRDADGNPTFSDKKSAGAEMHIVEELPSMPAFPVSTSTRPTRKFDTSERESTYDRLTIISPVDGTTLPQALNGDVQITALLLPELQDTDEIVLRDAGTEIMRGTETTFALTQLDRGEHRLSVEVVSAEGDTVIRSQTITLYVQRTSSLSR